MPTNEAEAPQRIWIHATAHRADGGAWFASKELGDEIPFVPASALEKVWEDAIKAIEGAGRFRQYSRELGRLQ